MPDLTTEGARGRTAQWLIGHFKDPPAYVPGSLLPPLKNFSDEQQQALTAFLQIPVSIAPQRRQILDLLLISRRIGGDIGSPRDLCGPSRTPLVDQ
jgi:hypothetical protein